MANGGIDWKSAVIGGGVLAAVALVGLYGYEYGVKDAATATATKAMPPQATPSNGPAAPVANATATTESDATPSFAARTAPEEPLPTAAPASANGKVGPPPIARNRLEILQTSYDTKHLIIMGSFPQNSAEVDKHLQRIATCLGVTPHNIQTGFYEGLTPNLNIIHFGGYDKAEANAVLQWVKPCAPDAYIKQARWIGD